MAIKSVIDIDVKDERFDAFLKLFKKYQDAMKRVPEDWARQDKIVDTTRKRFDKMTDAMRKQDDLLRGTTDRQEKAEKESTDRWEKINKQSGGFLRNVTRATAQLFKWGTITGVAGGLLGAGGLFGVSRLAGSVGAGRRSSLGLGTSYGDQRAFELNYARLVDPRAVLSGVSDAMGNAETRYALAAAGVSGRTIAGGNTVEISKELLVQMKRLADHTDPSMYQQQITALGLANLGITVEDLRRLRGTSQSELSQIQRRAEQDTRTLQLVEETQRAWQDLDVQLSRAGATVENSFAKGLKNVIVPIEHLSDAAAKAVETFLASDNAKYVIDELSKGIKFLGDYLASTSFKAGLIDFGQGIVGLGHVLGRIVNLFSGGDTPTAPGQPKTLHELTEDYLKRKTALNNMTINGKLPGSTTDGLPWWLGGPSHNPGNLKVPGGAGFQNFDSDEQGMFALYKQILRNETTHGQDTLRKLIYGNEQWAGYTTTDQEAYLRNLVRGVGIAPDAKLDPTNREQMSKIMSVITKQEGRTQPYGSRDIRVFIENNTGGNAVVTTSQAAQ